MKNVRVVIVAAFVFLLSGCASRRAQSGFYQYNFEHDGRPYQIISSTQTGNGKYNLLIHETNLEIKLRAVDYNQDGKLDSIIVGNMDLDMANRIYTAGISTAEAKGSLNRKKPLRVYELNGAMVRYRIQTIVGSPNLAYNRFSIHDMAAGTDQVIVDKNADGVLDHIETGNREMHAYQRLYEMTLLRGEQVGAIKREDQFYMVRN